MIKSFRNELIEMLFYGKYNHKKLEKTLPKTYFKVATRLLRELNKTVSYHTLVSYNLENLKGQLKEYKAIRISGQYRIIFKTDEDFNCYDVYIDDHSYQKK